jgi:CheY-like chemotaxis protein
MSSITAPAPKLVLCVDDEVVGLTVRKTLLEHAGYKVLTAPDGPEGLRLFHREPVDAVVLDYFMPGMRGTEVAVHMRSSKPDVPILLLSAHLGLSERLDSLVNVYMVKGAGAPAFLHTLGALIDDAPLPNNLRQ